MSRLMRKASLSIIVLLMSQVSWAEDDRITECKEMDSFGESTGKGGIANACTANAVCKGSNNVWQGGEVCCPMACPTGGDVNAFLAGCANSTWPVGTDSVAACEAAKFRKELDCSLRAGTLKYERCDYTESSRSVSLTVKYNAMALVNACKPDEFVKCFKRDSTPEEKERDIFGKTSYMVCQCERRKVAIDFALKHCKLMPKTNPDGSILYSTPGGPVGTTPGGLLCQVQCKGIAYKSVTDTSTYRVRCDRNAGLTESNNDACISMPFDSTLTRVYEDPTNFTFFLNPDDNFTAWNEETCQAKAVEVCDATARTGAVKFMQVPCVKAPAQ